MLTIGEERNHFGYDAIRDRYTDTKKDKKYQEKKRKNNNTNNK